MIKSKAHFSQLPQNQLNIVFKLCDRENTGRIRINYLQDLAKNYEPFQDNCLQNVIGTLHELDDSGQGTLTFKEFCSGVEMIMKKHRTNNENLILRRYKKNKMSPTLAMPESTTTSTPTQTTNTSVISSPTFLLNNSSTQQNQDVVSKNNNTNSKQEVKSQCSSLSDGENYEWNGEGGDIDADSGISSDIRNSGDGIRTHSPSSGINRQAWLRTSLRRSSSSNYSSVQDNLPNRRWGSFRHNGKRAIGTSNLTSFNSSGRSSTCDAADDMYSDASLEEDVHNLHHKYQTLQNQVDSLQDTAHHSDERYTRTKSDNAALQARVIMLEEQLRDTEIRCDERIQDEQKRSKETVTRLERERHLQLENANIRLQAAEQETTNLREETVRQRMRIDKLDAERADLLEQVQEMRAETIASKEQSNTFKEKEKRLNQENKIQSNLIEDLSRELQKLRSATRTPALPTTSAESLRLDELHAEMASLRTRNSQLQEAIDELQANLLQAGLEQGHKMLTATENSLAAELEAMTHNEPGNTHDPDSLVKMQQALKEQQDVNVQLRNYIDGILLNIVENHPQLLEVKQRSVV